MIFRSCQQNRGLGFATTVAALLFLLLMIGCKKNEAPPPPAPPEVEVTTVIEQNVPIYKEWVAQLNGQVNADITPKVQGYLLRRNYSEGFFVSKGQLLYEIDPRPFVAALDQAKAQVAMAEAQRSEADNNVVRDRPLAAQSAIPQKQLDTDISTLAASTAQVDAAKANMAQAELNLAWTKVYSPIDGVAGISNANVGDLVGTTTKMTTVSQVNPIRAYFNLSERDYLGEAQAISRLIRGATQRGPAFEIEFIQANGEPFPAKGKITLVNREIASSTGTIQLAAEFANKDGILRPGGFGTVRIETGTSKNALLVPQAAVIEVQSMYQIVVVTPDNKANFRPIKVGERVGTNWIITEGIKPGEKVIVQGFMKVRQGTPVTPKPYVVASAPGSN
ncbi:efflux RND transporter periplasmic adaptor subunit [Edaphobacter modestus]|uniref:Membrane fusion protein (Multidrug efflux system) n=1 Tax=Edaphobacter modestus TaxID=388466 RepID=A0A4Q7YSQ1_9BACT|nr:efflux RND transporter periplasmic adaptor subunit [Edaphobacter modestus]RZU40767.1 membrane fusion protein (multidrug efflux system) [Edaphobacter modestus]